MGTWFERCIGDWGSGTFGGKMWDKGTQTEEI